MPRHRRPLAASSYRRSSIRRAVQSAFEPLETRRLLCAVHTYFDPSESTAPPIGYSSGPEVAAADIIWTNRGVDSGGNSDGFLATFGANANVARGVMDAVIESFERMIGDFNYSDSSSNFNLTVRMSGNHNGASAQLNTGNLVGGKPKSGTITMGKGTNGLGGGWFIDPTPYEHSEFLGNIVNAFSGDAPSGSPASNLGDFFTVAAAEITHVLGLYGNNLPGWAARTTNTFVPDTAEGGGRGTFYVFQGPSIKHLLTSNNGGGGGSDWGSAVHGAGPGVSVPFGGDTYIGAQDIGNAIYEFSRRYIPSNTFALMFKDAYNYSTVNPAQFGTFYSHLTPSSGQLLVRGGTSSADNITISSSGSILTVSVDVGNDVPGTGALAGAGNLPAFVTEYDLSQVSSIVIQAGDGNDTITISGPALPALITIDGGVGSDIVNLTNIPAGTIVNVNGAGGSDTFNVNSVQAGATVSILGGANDDTFNLGGGDIRNNLAGTITLDGEGGSDTVVFDDNASSGNVDYTIDATAFSMTGLAVPLGFSGAESITLKANGGNNTIALNATIPGRPVTVLAGGGNDHIVLGTGLLTALPALITVDGQGGSDTITLDDSAAISGSLYSITATEITRSGFGSLVHSNSEVVRLLADRGASAITVHSTAAGTQTVINGGEGNDVITINETHTASPVRLENSLGNDTVSVNTDGGNAAGIIFVSDVTKLASLTIGNAGRAELAAGDKVLVASLVSVDSASQLDLTDGTFIWNYSGSSPGSTLQSLLTSGYAGGAWNGNGINSSIAAADGSGKKSLGYSEAGDLFSTFPVNFANQEIDSTTLLVRQTLYGDANLDRQVNLADFNRLAASFGSGTKWSQGNFNYDSTTNLADFNLLAANFGSAAGAEGDDALAALLSPPVVPVAPTKGSGSAGSSTRTSR